MTKLSLQVFIQKTISEYEFWTKACEWLRKTTAVLIISPRAATVSLHTFEFQLAKLHIRDSKNYSKFANDREQAGPEYSLISISKWIYWRRKIKNNSLFTRIRFNWINRYTSSFCFSITHECELNLLNNLVLFEYCVFFYLCRRFTWGLIPSIFSDGGTLRFCGMLTWPKSTVNASHQTPKWPNKKKKKKKRKKNIKSNE